MVKKVLFQLHWLLGITAGLVIAVVGVTGGLLSFKADIQRVINPGLLTVAPGERQALPPVELYRQIQTAAPDKRITALALSADPRDAVRVTFAPPPAAPGEPPRRRGETRYVDPYSGELLQGQVRGEAFFRFTEDLHRRLVSGDTGKQIVGACTIVLIFFALSGLYLRWPRRLLDWRSWFKVDFSRKGRSFLWSLHSVIGTWVLPVYLLASLTGLYWSYEWYRDGLFRLSGVERPNQGQQRPAAPPAAAEGARPQQENMGGMASRGEGGARGMGSRGGAEDGAGDAGGMRRGAAPEQEAPLPDLDRAWSIFLAEIPSYSTASLRLPERAGQAVQITYMDADPPHERASNRLSIDADSGAVTEHARYDDKTLPEKLMGSMLPLHSGSFFGLPGLIIVMVASLLMPLFFITGWMLYLDRRAKKRATRAVRSSVSSAIASGADPFLIGFASQSGFAERLAWQTAGMLQTAGVPTAVQPLSEIDGERLGRFSKALFVVSTFGDGEPPDSARIFARKLMHAPIALGGMSFGLLALGDRHYGTFCGFGRALDEWLRGQGARPLFERVEVDDGDPDALRTWQQRVGVLAGVDPAAMEWGAEGYGHWRLVERRLLNPGSVGGPVFHLALAPVNEAQARWTSGDLIELIPRHPPARIERLLADCGLDGGAPVSGPGGARTSLREVLARSRLPAPDALRGVTPESAVRALRTLPKRRYSIASVPQDGEIHLTVRQVRLPDDGLGLGSGWLTEYAPIDGLIEMRVHVNPAFHLVDGDRPLILIGNGTGIAGLRAHLRARVLAGRRRNWLIFGERNEASDYHYRDEIEGWQAQGLLAWLDLAFSRDQAERVYVQDRLAAQRDRLREWVYEGAAIYVCGSIDGMAPAVDAVLADVLGRERLDVLAASGRYCRDIY